MTLSIPSNVVHCAPIITAKLPEELWTIVTKNLDDRSLFALSQTAHVQRKVALKEWSQRVSQSYSKTITSLNRIHIDINDSVATKKYRHLMWTYIHKNYFPSADYLKEKITTMLSAYCAKELVETRVELASQINNKPICWNVIKDKYKDTYDDILVKLILDIAKSSSNPQEAKSCALKMMCANKLEGIIIRLIQDGPLSAHDQNYLIFETAKSGCLKALKHLLLQSSVSATHRGSALIAAVAANDTELVDIIFQTGEILPEDFGIAFETTGSTGNIELAKTLANHGLITQENRSQAVIATAEINDLEFLKYLLDMGPILKERAGIAATTACNRGYFEFLKELLQRCPISREDRGLCVESATEKNEQDIVQFLLNSGRISKKTRGQACIEAAQNGYTSIFETLIQSGNISKSDYKAALEAASRGNHLKIVDYLNNATL